MTNIILHITGAKARAVVNGVLTSGMVGIPVSIQCDDSWNGLTKNLVCRCGQWGPDRGETRTILDVADTATVAHEVMQAGRNLYLGVEGYSADGKLVIPTTWADCGKIQPGAAAGADPSADPKLPVWAQLQTRLEKIEAHLEELLAGGGNPDVPEDPEITYFTIEKKLINAAISNDAATVQEGASYSAVITASEGYTIKTVQVTMGGAVVPVDGNVIHIPSVTGNIVIVATAELKASGGDHWESGVPYTLTGKITTGMGLAPATGGEVSNPTYAVTDYLYCNGADCILPIGVYGWHLHFYDIHKNWISAQDRLIAVPDGAAYFRISGGDNAVDWLTETLKVTPIAKTDETYTPGVQEIAWSNVSLNVHTGAETPHSSYCTSDFICVVGAACLRANNPGTISYALYEADKKFIGGLENVMLPAGLGGAGIGEAASYIKVVSAGVPMTLILDDSEVYDVTTATENVGMFPYRTACSSEPYYNKITAASGYTLEGDGAGVSVTMGGVDITDTAYTAGNGIINIGHVTGDITITATAVAV